jgi:hypothetical protein
MKLIPLTQGQVAIVDDQDYERLSRFKWHATRCRNSFYAASEYGPRKDQKGVFMHRLIIYARRGMEVDHINGDTLDNRRHNLRLATRSQNARNSKTRRDYLSGFKGVCFDKERQKWMAYITLRQKYYNLGRFDTREEAAMTYDKAARLLHREFARTNGELAWD